MYKIYTFGDFDIRYNDESILDTKGYQYRMLALFKYFITFNEKKSYCLKVLLKIYGQIMNFMIPKNVLRTQISRLRRMINLDDKNLKQFYRIEHSNGYYVFKTNDNCVLDVQLFKELIDEGNSLKENDPQKSFHY